MQTIYEEKGSMAIFDLNADAWKTITELQTDNNEIIKEKDKILETIEKFYRDVYSSKTTVSQVDFDECIWDIEIPKLDNKDFYE